jgi:predicted nucleic acid-binding protein
MATLEDRSIFVDTNVLIYANVASAPYHQPALERLQNLDNSGTKLWISRQILREFIATLTRPQTFVNIQLPEVIVERIQFFEQRFQIAEDNGQVTSRLSRWAVGKFMMLILSRLCSPLGSIAY